MKKHLFQKLCGGCFSFGIVVYFNMFIKAYSITLLFLLWCNYVDAGAVHVQLMKRNDTGKGGLVLNDVYSQKLRNEKDITYNGRYSSNKQQFLC